MNSLKRLKILLIEDSSIFARAIEALLRTEAQFEFDLVQADSIASATTQLKQPGLDVLLLDLSLPDSQGLESLRLIRKFASYLPIVVLTGIEDEQTAIRALQEGAQDYLHKVNLDGRTLSRSILYSIERNRLHLQRDDFMAALVHDVKNPLISNDQILQLILDKQFGELQPQLLEIATLLKQSNETVLHLLLNLLEIQKYDACAPTLNFDILELGKVVNSVIRQLLPLARLKGLNMSASVPQNNATVLADALAIERVLLNLIGNSIKFTPNGGLVEIKVFGRNGTAVITIKDSGIGISSEDQQFLFQRFYQTRIGKSQNLGTGLGLYVCKQIVEAHLGKISCFSNQKQGTTMTIDLPRLVD